MITSSIYPLSAATKGFKNLSSYSLVCLLMISSHIAHDCLIESNVILANNATLAGHVQVHENAILGGNSAVHQYVKIGKYAMIGGMSGVEKDIIPYGLYIGIRTNLKGINIIGLKRKGLENNKIKTLNHFIKENLWDEARVFVSNKKFSCTLVSSILSY